MSLASALAIERLRAREYSSMQTCFLRNLATRSIILEEHKLSYTRSNLFTI
jgi:hypothetical protein